MSALGVRSRRIAARGDTTGARRNGVLESVRTADDDGIPFSCLRRNQAGRQHFARESNTRCQHCAGAD